MKSATSPLLLALCLLASAATAARTDEGTWSLAGSLMVDTASYVGTDIDLDLYAGQYVQTGFLLGGYAGVWDNDLITILEGGATGKYHVLDNLASPFSPFIRRISASPFATSCWRSRAASMMASITHSCGWNGSA